MNKYLKSILRPIKYFFPIGYSQFAYGQEGEDLILNRFFLGKKNGFYVDIGAHHPYRFSNTYYFYKKGWKGINIDPLPNSMTLFKKVRPKDINLEIGIAEKEEVLIYNIFNEPTLNGFSDIQTIEYQEKTQYKLLKKIPIKVFPLSTVLNEFCSEGQEIDFFSIDVEGLDLQVLKSNDWEKYRPKMVLAESHKANLENIKDCPIFQFMKLNGYELYGKSVLTYFYIDRKNGNSNSFYNF